MKTLTATFLLLAVPALIFAQPTVTRTDPVEFQVAVQRETAPRQVHFLLMGDEFSIDSTASPALIDLNDRLLNFQSQLLQSEELLIQASVVCAYQPTGISAREVTRPLYVVVDSTQGSEVLYLIRYRVIDENKSARDYLVGLQDENYQPLTTDNFSGSRLLIGLLQHFTETGLTRLLDYDGNDPSNRLLQTVTLPWPDVGLRVEALLNLLGDLSENERKTTLDLLNENL